MNTLPPRLKSQPSSVIANRLVSARERYRIDWQLRNLISLEFNEKEGGKPHSCEEFYGKEVMELGNPIHPLGTSGSFLGCITLSLN